MPYQMKNGKWRGKKMIAGAIKTKVFATKTEAKKWESAQSAQEWQARENPTLTISWHELMTAYLDMAATRFSRKTYNEKRLAARASMRIISPSMPAQEAGAKQALAIMRLAATGNAANKIRKNLAAAWEWGKKFRDLPAHNPFLDCPRFPEDRNPRRVPAMSEFWRVYDAAREIDKPFLLFLLHTGTRVGEAFRLEWSDVDFGNCRVRLGTRKTAECAMTGCR